MADYDVIIQGGAVFWDRNACLADVGIVDGRIAAIGNGLGRGRELLQADGCFVLPGIVDPHVHVAVAGDPNMDPIIEDLAVATRGAVLGGTTTVCSYIRAVPGQTVSDAVKGEVERGLEAASTDFALNLLCTPDEDLPAAVKAGRQQGITTFKGMLAYRTRGLMLSDGEMLQLMYSVASVGGTLLVHAENGLATEVLEAQARAGSTIDNAAYLATSPGCLEAEGAFRAAALASVARCPLIYVHMSAKESLAVARFATDLLGVNVTWETQPHYLLLTNDAVVERGALAKVGPPLRESDDVEAIRRALATGILSHLSSDHAPRDRSMKLSRDNILDAPHGGTTGSGLVLRIALELWRQGTISIERLVEVVSSNAAKAYGLYPQKGALRPGADADLVVVPREFDPVDVHADEIDGPSDYSIYEGLPVAPPPRLVLRHGTVVARDGIFADMVPATYLRRP